MRFGGFQFALLALALSACADSDRPIAGFETITIEGPPPTAPQLGDVEPADAPPTAPQRGEVEPADAPVPARKPAQMAGANAPSQPKRRAQAAREARPAPAREKEAAMTLTPEDVALRPEPLPQAAKPALSAPVTQEDAQGRTVITPRIPNHRQATICKDAAEAACKGLAACKWTDTYSTGSGGYVKGHCESK